MINLNNSISQILFNPRLSSAEKELVEKQLQPHLLPDHFWVATSGSTGQAKWVALSKKAVLASAEAVNSHLECSAKDVWLLALPSFHVGGLGVWARAHLSGAKVIDWHGMTKWEPKAFVSALEHFQATLTALVPTQVYDLVKSDLAAPSCLRAVVIGGGKLEETIYLRALELGWKLLPSYGMTECASQIATASLDSWQAKRWPQLKLLDHVVVKSDAQGVLWVKGASLLTGYVKNGQFVDPKQDGWLCTEDRGQLDGHFVHIAGRLGNCVKIGGEWVDLDILENKFQKTLYELKIENDAAIFACPDARLGHAIHMAIDTQNEQVIQTILDQFHLQVLPFERIRKIHSLDKLPRTPLGKFVWQKL